MSTNPGSASPTSNTGQQTIQPQKKGLFTRLFPRGRKNLAAPGDQEDLSLPLKTARGSYSAALTLTNSVFPLPVVATLVTALFYVGLLSVPELLFKGWPTGLPALTIIGMGLALTLVLWLFVSFGFIPSTSFDSVNVTSASHFKRHFAVLVAIHKTLEPYGNGAKAITVDKSTLARTELKVFSETYPVDYTIALDSIHESLVNAQNMVRQESLLWVQGNGYLSAWQFIHRAEEAMLVVAPRDIVVSEAMHDAAAIRGTGIANRDVYLSNLAVAVKVLNPSSAAYLKALPLLVMASDGATPEGDKTHSDKPVGDELVSQPPAETSNKEPETEAEIAARCTLRYARNILNEYRSSLWDNLLRVRGQLTGTAMGTGLLTFFLLCVAICAGVQPQSLLAALVFYLVGAMSGLFGQLVLEAQSDKAIDDYGLTIARVVVTPVISGLAAIAGILVVSLLSVNIFNTPGQDIARGTPLPNLSQIYDLVQNRQGLVIAALFGLAPSRFMSILQTKIEDTKSQLKSTAASQGQSTPV